MDTNMSQALKLAGGILIALVLISGLTIMFGQLSPSQNTLEDIKAFEQTQAFNKEFEVYDKDIMYGLDVISAINKAASYNKTYIEAYDNLSNGEFEYLKENYLINVIFEDGDIELEQNFTISKVVRNGAGKLVEMNYEKSSSPSNPELNISNLIDASKVEIVGKLKNVVKLSDNDLENEDRCEELIEDYANVSRDPQTISDNAELIDDDEDAENHKYINKNIYDNIIVPSSKQMKVIIQNNDTSDLGTDTGADQWSKATLETYVYSFKSKRFTCKDVKYSDITGRITSLTFAEI